MEATPAPATSGAEAAPASAPINNQSGQETSMPGSAATTSAPEGQISVKSTDQVNAESVGQDWSASFDPELKEYVTNKGFKDPKSVLDSYRNLEKLRGVPQERLVKLPESKEDTGWAEVYEKLGKPSTPEGYGLEVADGEDRGFTDWAKSTFHKMNMTKDQAEGLIDSFVAYNDAVGEKESENYGEIIKKQEMDLRKDWGAAYHQNVANAQRAQREFGLSDEGVAALEKAIGFDGLMKFMNNVGAKIGEAAYVDGQRGPGFGEQKLSPSEAIAKIQALKKDADFTSRYTSGDAAAKEKMSRLHQMAYPDS